ncbi:type V CRISPR-associated protein Cas12b [Alicyclobacillus mali (ex Roth et al. 2021)]|uniref:type V CRISPR-associated protein Cas12b n=1 Tax=Alicyclobacillus mali (ex Roth et al. 2021) TaxID=1123961 RepID=UPI001A8F6A10
MKSIKVKLMVGNRPDVREGMWYLHEAINVGVRYYTEWLALLRQGNLYKRGTDGGQELYMTSEQCQQELLKRLRDRQRTNGHTGDPGTDEELLRVARQLYEVLVPQSVGKQGNAQMLSRKFLSPLTDPNSKGGKGTSKAGRKHRWILMKEAGDPAWVEAKARDDARKAVDPTKHILDKMESLGIKPLMDVFTETWTKIGWKPLRQRQGVRPWDRDMFQQALERLMSWESWNQRVGEEYARLVGQRDRFREKFAEQGHLVALAQRLEEDLKASSAGFEAKRVQAYRITMRALRGMQDIIQEWIKLPETESMERFDMVIKRWQAKNPRKFGSHDLFYKLAEPDYRPLWREDPTFLERWANYNSILNKLDRAKQFATFTLPDPYVNPVWVRFENAEGTNISRYTFHFDHVAPGHHAVVFDRFVVMKDGVPTEEEHVAVSLAPSGQLDRIIPAGTESPIDIVLDDPGAQGHFQAEFGGAKVQYRRNVLERVGRNNKLLSGMERNGFKAVADRVGDVFLNLSIRVTSPSEAMGDRRPPHASLFQIAENTYRVTVRYDRLAEYLSQHPDMGEVGASGLFSGLRVMSVDLGLRTAASVSVFRLARKDQLSSNETSAPPLCFPVFGSDELVAVHERSHLIRLPGEVESKRVRQIREARMGRLSRLRAQVSALRMVVRVGVTDEQARKRNWDRLNLYLERGDGRIPGEWWNQLRETVRTLDRKSSLKGDAWIRMVQASVRPLWRSLAKDVHNWRKEVRSGGDKVKVKGLAMNVPGGHSIAHLEYLERQYRFLRSWSSFSTEAGQVVRAERDSRFAVALREHLDNAKQDRLKKLADRILMEALGYVYVSNGRRSGGWQAKYPPCQLILLEELSEYRFSNDRPPSENRQLRVWSHRGVLTELVNQAQMHDVLVGTIPAAFSSRFDARTGAPGVRCRRAPETRGDVPVWLTRYLEEEAIDLAALRPGQLIPTGDGEFLVTPAGKGDAGIRVVHADLNAAHNLQKRLWENFDLSDIRIRGDRHDTGNEFALIPRLTNKRLEKNYKSKMFVSQDGKTFTITEGKNRTIGSGRKPDETLLSEEELEFLAQADDNQQQSMVLFRDPSGYVNGGRWTEQKTFWAMVKARVDRQLRVHYANHRINLE